MLGVDEVEVDVARMGYGCLNGGLGDFVEHDAPCFLGVEPEHLGQVPGDGFSLTVFIGREPYGLRFPGMGPELAHHVLLVGRNFILGFERVEVHAKVLFLQVADVPVAGHHLEVGTKEFLDGLCFGGRLYYD